MRPRFNLARTDLRLGGAKLRHGSFAAGGLKPLGRGLTEAKETFKVFNDAKEACIISNSMTAPLELVPQFQVGQRANT